MPIYPAARMAGMRGLSLQRLMGSHFWDPETVVSLIALSLDLMPLDLRSLEDFTARSTPALNFCRYVMSGMRQVGILLISNENPNFLRYAPDCLIYPDLDLDDV